jgi:hypothetical protein
MEFNSGVVPTLEQRIDFVEKAELTLRGKPARFRSLSSAGAARASEKEGQDAILINNTLLSCMEGLSRAEKKEIKNSVRFAELLSDEFKNESTDLAGWLQLYSRALNHVGWYTDRNPGERVYREFSTDASQKIMTTVKELGGDLMSGHCQAAFSALKGNSSNLAYYARASQHGSLFQIMPSGRDEKGKLTLVLNHARLSAQRRIDGFLFFKWETETAVLRHNFLSFYLDRDAYAQTREKVEALIESSDMEEIELRL